MLEMDWDVEGWLREHGIHAGFRDRRRRLADRLASQGVDRVHLDLLWDELYRVREMRNPAGALASILERGEWKEMAEDLSEARRRWPSSRARSKPTSDEGRQIQEENMRRLARQREDWEAYVRAKGGGAVEAPGGG